ncbi:16S rRNA (guanine(966)-N(2))-methyltransferase RsmD [Tessaracoccus palaemonis]|uniref:16S rRNA (Guanine(966)-N(2))-methyltransferase RsmD n=1 Tax=Tessaracoccus palaemonis TaxID=2829499 RepID=A0ABX8SKB7_9ACTN|nr:16S rRNA (guanine(966)-N(2))-methyltransferase RsmD [Tessaracoccus palaemonis]QXT63826.1 16S rRNA (guanine(966)-N(2))-methyltransferase RsmD [Tessaracoccus palaemonis]
MSRIIAGRAKGRRLAAPKGANTRPTTDRTREALFSALASWFDAADAAAEEQLAGYSMLDLFAGTGAVGLEAASRGASPVVLVEADRPTAKLIAANAASAGLQADVRTGKAETFAAAPGRSFDLIFIDPPYAVPTEQVEALLAQLADGAVAPRGLVVVERSVRDREPAWPPAFTETWRRDYGETCLLFGTVD